MTSIALLPVDLSTFEGCKSDAADDAADDAVEHAVAVYDDTRDDEDQDNVALSQSMGRYPFSSPPVARPLVSRDGVSSPPPPIKSYMLMVGYNQVQLDNLLQHIRIPSYCTFHTICFQPDKHLRLVRVCEPTFTAKLIQGSHNHVLRCADDEIKRFHRRMMIAIHETTQRSFAAAIFQASLCKLVFPDHPNVKSLFSILAENTRKVSELQII